jgi:tRNA (guanine37-N1)-methyltransferase
MKFTILTLFPELFDSFLKTSLIARGISKSIINITLVNFRKWATDTHRSVDDRPYGGGVGMVLRVDVLDRALADIEKYVIANEVKQSLVQNQKSKINPFDYRSGLMVSGIESIKNRNDIRNPNFIKNKTRTILLTPQGVPFIQRQALRLAKKYDQLILIAGHYEGFDERVRALVDEEISIGDYVLTGGELPAMVVIDAVSRLIPGFLGKEYSHIEESFTLRHPRLNRGSMDSRFRENDKQILLEYPQYTRPETYTTVSTKKPKTLCVPKILLLGDHKKVKQWRLDQAVKRTQKRRPDLL